MEKSAWQLFKESQNNNIILKKEKEKWDPKPIIVNFTKKELVPGIWVYKNVFENTNKLISDIENLYGSAWQDGQVYGGEERSTNKSFRDCSVVVLNPESEAINVEQDKLYYFVKESMMQCLQDYVDSFAIGMENLTPDNWQVLKYGHGQHFDGHADDGHRFPRTVSITAYLNDSYTGGELDYKHFNLKWKPEKGDVLIFPSNYVYNHKVHPVGTGLRYALVNWFRWKTMSVDMLPND